jgi:dolichyl-phosphate-mannose-protein mannosyltransferase
MGVLTVSLMFLTLKATGCRTVTAVLGAGIVIFGTFELEVPGIQDI